MKTSVCANALFISLSFLIMAQPGEFLSVKSRLVTPNRIASAQSRYTITDLGTLGGDYSQAFGINDAGHVVGRSLPDNINGMHAFVWDGEVMTDLGGSASGDFTSQANAINNVGQAVGVLWSVGKSHAVLWQNGAMTDLDGLGGEISTAEAINNFGHVVGVSETATSMVDHAFLWQNGTMQDLGTLGGAESGAFDINDTGQVVGYTMLAGAPDNIATHAFLWQKGVMYDLGTLGGSESRAIAINNSGLVVGTSEITAGVLGHAFLWQSGSMHDLGTLIGGNYSVALDINDAGQVVGDSNTATGATHAFLWENGQMFDLNDQIPTNSGWILVSAEGINKNGQIVGLGYNNGHARPFLLTPYRPILIVPGIAGTYSRNTLLNLDLLWLIQRGVHPGDLQIDPLGHVYDDLIQTFINLGYEEGKDLFVVNYDWRLLPGPIDYQFDGHITGLKAQDLADDQFNYAVDYLGWYLRKVAEAYRLEYGKDLSQVNLISHSTGGLVARAYIQSDAYGGVYDPVNNYRLPTIDQFIMVGVPNRGASKAWNPIHNNWVADVAYRAVLSKIINRAYQKVTAIFGITIQGPDYNIDKGSIMVNGTYDEELFIEKYIPTIRSLLATYDFINFGEGFVNINQDPTQRNNLVLDLNNGFDFVPTVDPSPFASKTNATVICGASQYTAYQVIERTGTARQNVLLPFTDFTANDATTADEWYEDLFLANGGDGTVPLKSCNEQFVSDTRIKTKLFYETGIDHTSLMSDATVQRFVLDTLKIRYQPQNISTGSWIGYHNIISVISDPAETILVDGQGRRLGYSQATGVLTEIPGSVWFGDADGFGLVAGNVVEPLHIDLTGLGENHYVMVSVERFGRPAGGIISSGFLEQDQKVTIPVEIITRFVFLPLLRR